MLNKNTDKMDNTPSYEEALATLQQILNDLQNEQISIDDLAAKSKKAAELIQYCKQKLQGLEKSISEND